MADAALLRACENDEVAATSLYSITRLLNDPKDIYIAMRAEPRENYSDTYTASKEETTISAICTTCAGLPIGRLPARAPTR